MRYLRRPVLVEAQQWLGTPESADKIHLLAGANFQVLDMPWDDDPDSSAITRSDLQGGQWQPLRVGDYVVVDDEGRLFPLRKVIFEETYAPVA